MGHNAILQVRAKLMKRDFQIALIPNGGLWSKTFPNWAWNELSLIFWSMSNLRSGNHLNPLRGFKSFNESPYAWSTSHTFDTIKHVRLGGKDKTLALMYVRSRKGFLLTMFIGIRFLIFYISVAFYIFGIYLFRGLFNGSLISLWFDME